MNTNNNSNNNIGDPNIRSNIQRGIRIQQFQPSSSSSSTTTTSTTSSSNIPLGKGPNCKLASTTPPPSTSSCLVLELRNINFGDSGIPILAGILDQPQYHQIPIRSIDLRSNRLTDTGANALTYLLLSQLSYIESIDLRYNDINDDGIIALLRVLVPSKSLRTFYIGHNEIHVRGAG